MKEKELKNIVGGAISASYLGYIVRGANTILDIGRSLGSAIRRLVDGTLCPL